MHPNVWGPASWKTIHLFALGYPNPPTQEDRRRYANFYKAMGEVLPCSTCRVHFKQHLETLPIEPHLDTRGRLFEWTVALHNKVNASTGKPQRTPVDVYEDMRRESQKRPLKHVSIVKIVTFVTFLLLVVALVLLVKHVIRRR